MNRNPCLNGRLISAEFVPAGDPFRTDESDAPRPAGTYVTIRLDDEHAAICAGRVSVSYLPQTKE